MRATTVDATNPETPGGLQLGTDDAIAAHRALVDVVHEHGAGIQPQIVHPGPDGLGPTSTACRRSVRRSSRRV